VTEPDDRLAGSVRWAVVPFAPRPPFRVYAGVDHPPYIVATADRLVEAGRRGGDPELTYLVPGKARPVLLLAEPPDRHHREVAALRLLRLSSLDENERQRVRRGEEELLVYLDPSRVVLPDENAAMISALVRVHADAIATGPPAGWLSSDELGDIGERIVRFYGIDVEAMVERRIRELLARRRQGPSGVG
jgi:hypothetical protein